MDECFDVVISGAGIAGLLLAAELSKNCSVLLVEKNQEPSCTNKFWLTMEDCLDTNPNLIDCIDSNWESMDFISYDQSKFTVKGKYILWNSQKLQKQLMDEIITNKSTVLFEHRFYSYRQNKNKLTVFINDLEINTKLLVDCMGYSSPLNLALNTVKIYGYHILYGGKVKLKKNINPIALANVMIGNSLSYLEVFPMSDGYANVVLITSVREVKNIDSLKNNFEFIVKKSHYSQYFEPLDINENSYLGGIVPVGKVNRAAHDHILFFGEAGQIHPVATGTCMTKLLKHHKEFSQFIENSINSNKLTKKELLNAPCFTNKFTQRYQLNLYKQMRTWNSQHCSKFLELIECLDHCSMNDFLFNEINYSHFLNKQNLINVLSKKNLSWCTPFFKSILRIS